MAAETRTDPRIHAPTLAAEPPGPQVTGGPGALFLAPLSHRTETEAGRACWSPNGKELAERSLLDLLGQRRSPFSACYVPFSEPPKTRVHLGLRLRHPRS